MAESTLQDFFGLDRPDWLPQSYALLPVPTPYGCSFEPGQPVPAADAKALLKTVTEFAWKGIHNGDK